MNEQIKQAAKQMGCTPEAFVEGIRGLVSKEVKAFHSELTSKPGMDTFTNGIGKLMGTLGVIITHGHITGQAVMDITERDSPEMTEIVYDALLWRGLMGPVEVVVAHKA